MTATLFLRNIMRRRVPGVDHCEKTHIKIHNVMRHYARSPAN
jgi:hypothetical protein